MSISQEPPDQAVVLMFGDAVGDGQLNQSPTDNALPDLLLIGVRSRASPAVGALQAFNQWAKALVAPTVQSAQGLRPFFDLPLRPLFQFLDLMQNREPDLDQYGLKLADFAV